MSLRGSARGNVRPSVEALSLRELAPWAPRLIPLLRQLGVPVEGNEGASLAYLCEEAGLELADVLETLAAPLDKDDEPDELQVEQLEIVAGRDKQGHPEGVSRLTVRAGEVVALVGPTGSGKSQLLADVQSLAQGDSPSRRVILFDGAPPSADLRWSSAVRPVAQISQSMHFLLDLTVEAFLELHATSRSIAEPALLISQVIDAACTLCGEPFGHQSPMVALSGGQSRALMIADAVLVGRAPIILVDEIENAGIDRHRALQFLVGEGKMTLIATHDPLLALRGGRRVIFRNGAMWQVMTRSKSEDALLTRLEKQEERQSALRQLLRSGKRLTARR